jgi:hypothetical protein
MPSLKRNQSKDMLEEAHGILYSGSLFQNLGGDYSVGVQLLNNPSIAVSRRHTRKTPKTSNRAKTLLVPSNGKIMSCVSTRPFQVLENPTELPRFQGRNEKTQVPRNTNLKRAIGSSLAQQISDEFSYQKVMEKASSNFKHMTPSPDEKRARLKKDSANPRVTTQSNAADVVQGCQDEGANVIQNFEVSKAIREPSCRVLRSSHSDVKTYTTVESMDCSSGESLDLEFQKGIMTQDNACIENNRYDLSSLTPLKLEKLREAKVDDPKVISAMLTSCQTQTPSKRNSFPLGCTIEEMKFYECDSVDESQITMQTLEELGMGVINHTKSREHHNEIQLKQSILRSVALKQDRGINPNNISLSYSSKASRSRCLADMNDTRDFTTSKIVERKDAGKNNSIRFPTSHKKSCSLRHNVIIGGIQGTPKLDESSPPSSIAASAATSNDEHAPPYFREQFIETKGNRMIKLDRIPITKAWNILFEHEGKVFHHAPLPSGWELHVSKAKNRLFYSHPDHGSTWHCPIVNPLHYVDDISPTSAGCHTTTKLNASSLTEQTYSTGDSYSIAKSEIAEDDSYVIDASSICSQETSHGPYSMNGIQILSMCHKDKAEHHEICSNTNGHLNSVNYPANRAVTEDQSEISHQSSECHDGPCSDESDVRLDSPSHDSLDATEFIYIENRDPRNLSSCLPTCDSSPDIEIMNLVTLNCESKKGVHRKTLKLFDCDRLQSPSQIKEPINGSVTFDFPSKSTNIESLDIHSPNTSDIDKSKNSGSPIGCIQTSNDFFDAKYCDKTDVSSASKKEPNLEDIPKIFSPSLCVNNDENFQNFGERNQVYQSNQQSEKNIDAQSCFSSQYDEDTSDFNNEESDGTQIYENHFCGVDFMSSDDLEKSRIENCYQKKRWGFEHVAAISTDGDAVAITREGNFDAHNNVTNLGSICHPPNKVIGASEMSSITLGGLNQASYNGKAQISRMSVRILLPWHPICSLQQLDHHVP